MLKVKILILEDRSYSFSILPPTTGFLLMFVKEQQKLGLVSKSNKMFKNFISVKNVVQIAKFKFPNLELSISIPVILGSLIHVT